MVILRCLCGSEMLRLGVVIGMCEMSNTHISQENEHAILVVKCQFMSYTLRIKSSRITRSDYFPSGETGRARIVSLAKKK